MWLLDIAWGAVTLFYSAVLGPVVNGLIGIVNSVIKFILAFTKWIFNYIIYFMYFIFEYTTDIFFDLLESFDNPFGTVNICSVPLPAALSLIMDKLGIFQTLAQAGTIIVSVMLFMLIYRLIMARLGA